MTEIEIGTKVITASGKLCGVCTDINKRGGMTEYTFKTKRSTFSVDTNDHRRFIAWNGKGTCLGITTVTVLN